MPRNMPTLAEAIGEINNNGVKNALKAASKYLTDLAIRNIVDYIVILEERSGGRDGR